MIHIKGKNQYTVPLNEVTGSNTILNISAETCSVISSTDEIKNDEKNILANVVESKATTAGGATPSIQPPREGIISSGGQPLSILKRESYPPLDGTGNTLKAEAADNISKPEIDKVRNMFQHFTLILQI
jgi:hypothetical protein